jgi:hypothetical protein
MGTENASPFQSLSAVLFGDRIFRSKKEISLYALGKLRQMPRPD